MSDLLVTAFIADGGKAISVSYSSDAARWCATSVPQSSQASPALAVLNGDLWAAFRGASDSKIYSAGLSNWKDNTYVGQDSDLAPAVASLGTELWIAYIGQATGHVELVSSGNGSNWSATKTDTGQASKLSPALTAWNTALWAAFQGEDTQIYVASSSNWAAKTSTGQSSKFAPALALFNGALWVAYIGESAGRVELISSSGGSRWMNKIDTGQASTFAPALTVFNGKLWVGYIGEATKHVELVSIDTAGHVSAKIDTGQATQMAPALADIAAAAPPSPFGGNNQYIYTAPQPKAGQPGIPLQNLVVEIKVTDPIKVNPASGLSPKAPLALPIGFQINGFSPTSDDRTVGWQQYGVRMWPGANTLMSFAELWPTALETNPKLPNLFQTSSQQYNGNVITLPDDLTIPEGWTIRIQFQQQCNGTITGFTCTVTDKAGNGVGPAAGLGINLLNNVPLAAGGTVAQGDLAPIVAFQVVLVGNWDADQAVLVSGAGKVTCTSSTLMTPGVCWPGDASGNFGTAENTNSSYSLIPAQSSTSVAQTFGTTLGDIFGNSGYTLQMLVVTSGGQIMAGASDDGVSWWHGHERTPGFVNTGHTTQAAPSLVAVTDSANTGAGNFYFAMLGQDNYDLQWRGSSDGVNWEGGSIGSQQSKFAPCLMMYYNTNNSGVGPWLGYVATNASNDVLVTSALSWGNSWSGSTPINQTSKATPAFTGMIDYYVMVFLANDSSNRLLAYRTQPNAQGQWVWSGANDTGQQSQAAPSVAGLRSNLWMAFVSNDASQNILVCSSADGVSWSGATQTGHQSRTAPCMTNCGGILVMAYVGLGDGIVRISASGDGIHWSGAIGVEGLTSPVAPALAGYNFQLGFSLS